jgi:tyrosyl-tRNA synthetase
MCTRISLDEIGSIQRSLENDSNPRDVKMKLAREIVEMYHGKEGAQKGEKYFIETFQKGQAPEEVEEIEPEYTEHLIEKGFVKSKSELRRLLDAGGVKNADTGEKLEEIPDFVEKPMVLKLGKRRFVKLIK